VRGIPIQKNTVFAVRQQQMYGILPASMEWLYVM
jgi:hypothetical protein